MLNNNEIINPIDPPKTAKVYTGSDPMYDVLTRSKRNGVLDNKDGSYSTHKMEYNSTTDNDVTSYNVYPTLFQDIDDKWEDLAGGDAFGRAISKNEVYSFDNEKSAQEFSKGSWKNDYKEYEVDSDEYRELYPNLVDSKEYAKSNYQTIPNEELDEISYVEEPSVNNKKYRETYEKEFPKQNRIDGYLNGYSKLLGHTATNYPERIDNEHEEGFNDYFYKKMEESKGNMKRGEWLDSMEAQDRRIAMRSKHSKQNILEEVENGVRELTSMNGVMGSINNITSNNNYSKNEKAEILKELVDSPNMTSLVESSKALSVFDLPVRIIEGLIQSDYSIQDGLKGNYNDRATLLGDIILDPTNYIGVGALKQIGKNTKLPVLSSKLLESIENIKHLTGNDKAKVIEAVKSSLSNPVGDNLSDIIYDVNRKLKTFEDVSKANTIIDNIPTGKVDGVLDGSVFKLDSNLEKRGKYVDTMNLSSISKDDNSLAKAKQAVEEMTKYGDTRDVARMAIIVMDKSIEAKAGAEHSLDVFGTTRKLESFSINNNGNIVLDLDKGTKGSFSYLDKEGNVKSIKNDNVSLEVNNEGIVNVDSPFLNELNEGLASDKAMLQDMFPGSKVIGSAEIAQKHNMIEMPGDIDITITKSDFDKIDTTGMDIRDTKGINKILTVVDKNGNKLEYDINIIDPSASGPSAILSNEMKMYDVNNEYTNDPEGLFKTIDPELKSLVDIFISKKDKNINKGDLLMSLSNESNKIIEAHELLGKIYVGKEYKPLGDVQFGTYDDNIKLLEDIGFLGYNEIVAANPDKMKAALTQFYNDNTILSRNIDIGIMKESRNIGESLDDLTRSAMTQWKPELGGGTASGFGLNTVALGDSEHTGRQAIELYHGAVQPNPKLTSTKAEDIVQQIKNRFIDRELTPVENDKILSKLEELIPGNNINIKVGDNKISDYIGVINTDFTNWLAKEFNVASVQGNKYGNSSYRGMIGTDHYDEAAYRVLDINNTETPKSYLSRKESFEEMAIKPVISKIKELKKDGVLFAKLDTVYSGSSLSDHVGKVVKEVEDLFMRSFKETADSSDLAFFDKDMVDIIGLIKENKLPENIELVTRSQVDARVAIDNINSYIEKAAKWITTDYGVSNVKELVNEISNFEGLGKIVSDIDKGISIEKGKYNNTLELYKQLNELSTEVKDAVLQLSLLKSVEDSYKYNAEFKPGMSNFGKLNTTRKVSNNKE